MSSTPNSSKSVLWILACCLLMAAPYLSAGGFGVEMPANPAPGVVFPTAETVVNGWVFGTDPNFDEIAQHGWGIWAGMTTDSNTSAYNIPSALIYQTWLSPKAILALMNGDASPQKLELRTPLQFVHADTPSVDLLEETPMAATGMKIDYSIAESVAYSPPSAEFAFSNQLLWTQTLDTLVQEGYTEMPSFPNDAVNIKPVYKLISPAELNRGYIYAMPAWPGTPDVTHWTSAQKKAGYDNHLWNQCTYIDVTMMGASSATGVDPTCASPSADNTYSLADFISIPITSNDQAHYQSLTGGQVGDLAVGDTLILVGAHVTSRETERWTWQTFWWSANPDAPNTPSSAAIAAFRSTNLSPAASHYAMALAYSMLSPAQPLVGGTQVGALVPAYNPHLEAGFGTGVFGQTEAVQTPTGSVTTDLGVQSNCMSCHGMAGYKTANAPYVSNFYVSRDSSNFAGGMTVDFAWSIVDEAKSKPASD